MALCRWAEEPYSNCLIEVRPTSDVTKVVFHEYFDVKERTPLLAVRTVEVDLVKDNMVVVKGVDGLYIRYLEQSQDLAKAPNSSPVIEDLPSLRQ
jgi:hypothetical protein